MTVTFTLTEGSASTAAGPFNISGTTSEGTLNTVSIATGVTKAQLLTGHTVTNITPENITGGTIASTGATCPSSTTTWSITPPIASTSTLSFDYSADVWDFYLTNALSENIIITQTTVNGFVSGTCSNMAEDTVNLSPSVTITAGQTTASRTTSSDWSTISRMQFVNAISISNVGTLVDGDTFMVGSTTVTVSIDQSCQTYLR